MMVELRLEWGDVKDGSFFRDLPALGPCCGNNGVLGRKERDFEPP